MKRKNLKNLFIVLGAIFVLGFFTSLLESSPSDSESESVSNSVSAQKDQAKERDAETLVEPKESDPQQESESGDKPTATEQPDPEPAPEPEAEPKPEAPAPDDFTVGKTATAFITVIDGDTVDTEAGRVRIIGIDTPERGECGYNRAGEEISALVSRGQTVYLELPSGPQDQDRYERLLRYVYTESGVDIGLNQLEKGHAIARYDSTDGYPRHPKQDAYHAAQKATWASNGSVRTTYCPDVLPPVIPENPDFGDGWWLQYRSCSQLKKNTVGHPTGPFNVNIPEEQEIYNWFAYGTGYNGDGDWDGLACE